MSLAHAMLGLLSIQSMTGYELKHMAFDQTISHFWQADQAQIYRTLASMEAKGWLTSELTVQTDRPNKRLYHVTDAGQAELLNWLNQPQSPPVYREPFLVQMFFGAVLRNEQVLAQIERHRQHHQANLAEYDRIAAIPTLNEPADRQRAFWRMTLDLGRAIEQTYVDWLERCRTTVEELG